MYEIISTVIKKEPRFWKKFKTDNKVRFSDLSSRFTANRLLDGNNKDEVENAIYGCYPLHPISTFILPRLSERVAQNERTLFTFLSSDDKYSLSAFLSAEDNGFPLLTPDYLYDYFEPLLRKEPYTSEAHKTYKLTASVLQKVDEISLGAKIIKTVALIYLIEQYEKLPPTVDIISDTFCDSVSDVKHINASLTELIEKDCIVYLKRSNNYLKLKESSGVDIPSEISDYIEKNRATLRVKDILNRSAFDSFIYPTRYNDEFEITRYFDFSFIDSAVFFSINNWDLPLADTNSDGIVFAVIPQSAGEIKKISAAISEGHCASNRIVFIVPKKYYAVEKIAFEYDAVKHLRGNTGGDELLADEYDIYLDDLTEVLGGYFNAFARPENGEAIYFYGGKQQEIFRRSQMTELLSEICERIYWQTPIINNESINKNTLPTVAVNSRTKLLSGLLANELAPNLGLSGTGQDVSIMRSTLLQTGILLDAESNPHINLAPNNESLANMLSVVRTFFLRAKNAGGSLFSELYRQLTSPEMGIGLKRGLIPIYVATVLAVEKQGLVVKFGESEVKITPDLLNDINEEPAGYSVILEDWSEDKAAYIAGLEKIFTNYVSEREKSYNGFTYVVEAMSRWYLNLPKYAKELSKKYIGNGKFEDIDKDKKQFINSLKQSDGNPREYLLIKVFKIFKMEISPNVLDIIERIKADWDNAVPALIKTLGNDTKALFSKPRAKGSLSGVIKDWCESLSDKTRQYLFTGSENRILELMLTVPNDESAFIQRLAKAVTSLRIEDWTSETVKLFGQELTDFKKTVEEYNQQSVSIEKVGSNTYTITFADSDGNEVTKRFGKASYSKKAQLLMNDLMSSIEEMGKSITEQEKRQVLMELLQKLC